MAPPPCGRGSELLLILGKNEQQKLQLLVYRKVVSSAPERGGGDFCPRLKNNASTVSMLHGPRMLTKAVQQGGGGNAEEGGGDGQAGKTKVAFSGAGRRHR